MKTCTQCSSQFEVTDSDRAFYDRVSPVINGKKYAIPEPELCPDCRLQRRMMWRNTWSFYKTPCGLCKKEVLHIYAPERGYIPYCQECWWGDGWNALEYGQEFDFSRTFTEQFKELQLKVPRMALMNKNAENSEYCNYAGENKDCYLAVDGSWNNESCLFGTYYHKSQYCADNDVLHFGERCYEVVWGMNLYECLFCVESLNSSYCLFSTNLRNCEYCIFCTNLRNKKYHIFNKPVSKEKFEEIRQQLSSFTKLGEALEVFQQMLKTSIHPPYLHINCENSTGDYLSNCKNVEHCYSVSSMEDGKYLVMNEQGKDRMDCYACGYDGSELYYECTSAGIGGQNCIFSYGNWSCSNVAYCDTVMSCNDCFGCSNLKRKQYCILNKQYTKEEYEELVPKIIEHMQKTGEWGEFFAHSLAPYYYNESKAFEHFPLSEAEVKQRGYGWKKPEPKEFQPASCEIPDNIKDVPDTIVDELLACADCGRNYKIIAQELKFYRELGLPIPRKCVQCRHAGRLKLRRPIKFSKHHCSKCQKEFEATYDPSRPVKIYCEECYMTEVYGASAKEKKEV